MPVRIVSSKQNARLKELRRALASPGRKAEGMAGIEGPHLVEEALRAGLRISTVFVAEGMLHHVEKSVRLQPEVEVLVLPSAILAPVLSTETPQLVAALVEPRLWSWEDLISSRRDTAPLILVLAGLQDPGNLGTIVRSAEAFGATGIVSLPGTVSPWNPKAVRASAGSILRMPFLTADPEAAFLRLHDHDITIWTTATSRAREIQQAKLGVPVAVVIGNEGNGVPDDIARMADARLTIPCPGPVESLNAAVAASILLYEAARQRAAAPAWQRRVKGVR
jgi:TrmH family RNA methyltransferase